MAASVVCKMIYWFLHATKVAFKWVNPFNHGMHCIILPLKKKQKRGGFKWLYRKDLEEFRVKTKIFRKFIYLSSKQRYFWRILFTLSAAARVIDEPEKKFEFAIFFHIFLRNKLKV